MKQSFFSVNVAVLVKDASSNDVVADVSVEFTLGDLVLTETTNYEGVVIFTLRYVVPFAS